MPAFVTSLPLTLKSSSTFVCPIPSVRVNRTSPRHVFLPRPAFSMSLTPPAPLVPILMGSASDTPFCRKIATALSNLGIESELRIASAHKVPSRLLQVLEQYEALPRPKVYIAVAGRSNALSGVLDCAVSSPVVSCPPYSDAFAGADLFSSIRMPSGVAPMLVLDPSGAALAAAKILSLGNDAIRTKVDALQRANRDRLYVDDAQLTSETYRESIAQVRTNAQTVTETSSALLFGERNDSVVTDERKGKVRDQYAFEGFLDGKKMPLLALVTTDRQSAFDRILASIPFKGAVLNKTAAFWFNSTQHIVPNHLITVPHPNVTLARRCKPFPIEFVVRGYITGSTSTSLWKNYSNGVRNYCGIQFPDGLFKNQKLDSNVITPTTKEEVNDRPISPKEIVEEGFMTQEDFDYCADKALKLFEFGQKVAAENGLILVDTKYEFGRDEDGTIRLIDEIHTPDSSRYWLATSYEKRLAEKKEPENVDKEFLRLWFTENCDPYDKSKALPGAPDDLVDELSRRYIMLYELITGGSFDDLTVGSGVTNVTNCLSEFVGELSAAAR
ncbi:Phosphoribosylaminoimidazole-succinocarboxamide synthase [Gracilariopsis chorda]|uniref:SAICAR synthetase n=1 Tax=Gracilariopsis chorda TaxID=448386 RepID=A0A2V3IIJ5_9FLOR|nr:Phosphoribosylaminoimidazole-succinocarboxamide synthase [Gracilariopsis chorda]|eukprot:PXF41868.1 Phosphoribosylaminoimidazole-succinocarboxamide synthase [Gracilariopsis chorda]